MVFELINYLRFSDYNEPRLKFHSSMIFIIADIPIHHLNHLILVEFGVCFYINSMPGCYHTLRYITIKID